MPKIIENTLLIYTDGSLYPKGRKGGFGVIFIYVDSVGEENILDSYIPVGTGGTTNNRMELQACIEALKLAPDMSCFDEVNKIVIRTDSRYITDNYLSALSSWSKQKWKNKHGRPIENADLWKTFAREFRKIPKRIDLEWVKGHGKGKDKDPHNYSADKLAKASAKHPLSKTAHRSSVRRKKSPKFTKRGSITLTGENLIVYIVEVEWMPVQRVWKYRYQLESEGHPEHQNLDFIFSEIHLRDGHYYEVKVNDDNRNPKILELVREIIAEDLNNS